MTRGSHSTLAIEVKFKLLIYIDFLTSAQVPQDPDGGSAMPRAAAGRSHSSQTRERFETALASPVACHRQPLALRPGYRCNEEQVC